MNPFEDLTIQPSYGKNQALLKWRVAPGFDTGDFYVYRSLDGLSGWTLLNEEPVNRCEYADNTFVIHGRVDVPHYRLLLEFQGKEYESPIVGLHDKLSRNQYNGARRIMQLEFLRMFNGNGTPMLLYKPLRSGVRNPNVIAETGQIVGLRATDPATDCYGQTFVGGFEAPIPTFVELMEFSDVTHSEDPQGTEENDDLEVEGRILPFPFIGIDDLLINPATDNRYGVVKISQTFCFKGCISAAVAHKISLRVLRREDPRYRVPVPFPIPTISRI